MALTPYSFQVLKIVFTMLYKLYKMAMRLIKTCQLKTKIHTADNRQANSNNTL